jgi:hypothetical protein
LAREVAFKNTIKPDVETRVREAVEAVLEEGMVEYVKVAYRELILTHKGERNGYYTLATS